MAFGVLKKKSKTLEENSHKNRLVFTHTGTLTNGQRIELFLDAILNLKKKGLITSKHVQVNLIGLEHYPEQMNRIKKYIEELGSVLRTTKRLSKEQAVAENMKSDYLINFTDSKLSAIYGKTYGYIACKKPILVIPRDNGLLDNLVKDNKLGLVLDTSNEIEQFILNPKTDFEPIEKNLSFFTRQNQARIMTKYIDEIRLKNG